MSALGTAAANAALDLPLGAIVSITGTVVGRSEFASGRPTYLVEFDQKGRAVQEWFHADDLDEFEGGDGI